MESKNSCPNWPKLVPKVLDKPDGTCYNESVSESTNTERGNMGKQIDGWTWVVEAWKGDRSSWQIVANMVMAWGEFERLTLMGRDVAVTLQDPQTGNWFFARATRTDLPVTAIYNI